MKLSKSALKNVIKKIIRESLNERGVTSPEIKIPGAPTIIGKIKPSVGDLTKNGSTSLLQALKPKKTHESEQETES